MACQHPTNWVRDIHQPRGKFVIGQVLHAYGHSKSNAIFVHFWNLSCKEFWLRMLRLWRVAIYGGNLQLPGNQVFLTIDMIRCSTQFELRKILHYLVHFGHVRYSGHNHWTGILDRFEKHCCFTTTAG